MSVRVPSWKWGIFWAALCLTALIGELIAVATNGATDSFSSMVWFAVGLSPFIFYPAMLALGAGGALLIYHFFTHRQSP